MKSTGRWLAIAGCSVTGLILAAPVSWINLTHRRVSGELREVFVTPLDDGQARFSVVYNFSGGGYVWLGSQQDDGWMRPGADVVMPLAQAQEHAEALRNASLSGEQRRGYPVFYRVNDPSGTAFISLTSSPLWTSWKLGIGCLLISLLLSLPIFESFFKVKRAL